LWLGASPETLITIENKRFKTMSLAGTQKVDYTLNNWTIKEKNEQQIVTDFLVEKLKPITKSLQVSEAETVQAGNLIHLKSTISGVLLEDSLKLVIDTLHPTPAVCGYPREAAKEFILKEEHYNREFYTGFMGELNFKKVVKRNKKRQNVENNAYNSIDTISNLFVNLRCMQIKDFKALIYVGGGITQDSIPQNEWEETVSKSLTMKKVLY
jgi:isochorismate synthase